MLQPHVKDFIYHALPNWISALCALCVLGLTAYTLLAIHSTEGKVNDIMQHMGLPVTGSPQPAATKG